MSSRKLLKLSIFSTSSLASSLIILASGQDILAQPLKSNSVDFNKTHSNTSYIAADLRSNTERILDTQAVDLQKFCQNYPYNSRCNGNRNKPSLQQLQPQPKKLAALKQRSGYSLNSKLSTLGIGFEGTRQFTPNLNGRVGMNYAGLQVNQKQTNLKYDADIKLFSIAALGDWYPWKSNGFHLTTGLVYNNNRADATGEVTSPRTFRIGNRTITASQVEKLRGKIKYSNAIAPYIGIGYGNPVNKNSQLSFSINAGVMFTGSPDVDFSSPNEGNFPQLAQVIKREEDRVQKDLNKFSVYPVLSLGVSYQF